MSAAWQRGLYAITDPVLTPPRRILEQVRAAISGGAVMIQYRDKSSPRAESYALATALLALCRSERIPLIINDDVELAGEIGAEGVHLGHGDAMPAIARARLGAHSIIGVSCYNDYARAEQAAEEGADYVAFGRFFSSLTKPDAVRAEVELLRQARSRLSLPIAAIGGITARNGAALIAAGADLLAAVAGVFNEPDPCAAAQTIASLFKENAARA